MLNFEVLKTAAADGFGMQVNQICHLYGDLKKTEARLAQCTDPNVFRNVPGYGVRASEHDVRKALNIFADAVLNLHCLYKNSTGKCILTEMVGNLKDRLQLLEEFDQAVYVSETTLRK